jgi:hypothetical protein
MAGGEADGSDMEDEWVDHDEDDGDDEYDDLLQLLRKIPHLESISNQRSCHRPDERQATDAF